MIKKLVEDTITTHFAAQPFTFDQLMGKIDNKLTSDQVRRAMRDITRLHKSGKNGYRYHMRGKV